MCCGAVGCDLMMMFVMMSVCAYQALSISTTMSYSVHTSYIVPAQLHTIITSIHVYTFPFDCVFMDIIKCAYDYIFIVVQYKSNVCIRSIYSLLCPISLLFFINQAIRVSMCTMHPMLHTTTQ